jgi:hypothetical protein
VLTLTPDLILRYSLLSALAVPAHGLQSLDDAQRIAVLDL